MVEGKMDGWREREMNRPFSSSLVPLFQNESKCETGFALRLVLTRRQK